MKRILTSIITFSFFFFATSAQAEINYCSILHIKQKRISHHISQLKNLNELKALVTEAQEVKNMLHRRGQLPGKYDGFDQVLSSMQKEVNELVNEQRGDVQTFGNYTLGTIVFSLVVFKHLKSEFRHKSINKTLVDMALHHKIKACMLLSATVMIYLGYNKFKKINQNAQKVVELKGLIEKLNGLEIKQGEIDFLQGLIQEDQEKLKHNMRLWSKQGKIKSASFLSNGEVSCR